MSDTSPAAATGLPVVTSFDRRSFLATLAAAGVMTGAALPASATDASLDPDAGLIEMVAALFAAAARDGTRSTPAPIKPASFIVAKP